MNAASHKRSGAGLNLGYWLGLPYRRHGYMTEAARGFIGHGFAAAACDIICSGYSGAFADNAPSLRAQDKLSLARDGETMLFARPRGAKFPHVNTKLAQAAFEAPTQ
jgi:RimJ/RimL family protein N-acetyltransferase